MTAPDPILWLHQRQTALERVQRLIIEAMRLDLEPDDVDPDTPLFGAGLALDSIDAVELVTVLDSELGLKLPQDQSVILALRTVNTIVDRLMPPTRETT